MALEIWNGYLISPEMSYQESHVLYHESFQIKMYMDFIHMYQLKAIGMVPERRAQS